MMHKYVYSRNGTKFSHELWMDIQNDNFYLAKILLNAYLKP